MAAAAEEEAFRQRVSQLRAEYAGPYSSISLFSLCYWKDIHCWQFFGKKSIYVGFLV
jgi:hypothetical protein